MTQCSTESLCYFREYIDYPTQIRAFSVHNPPPGALYLPSLSLHWAHLEC